MLSWLFTGYVLGLCVLGAISLRGLVFFFFLSAVFF